MVKQVGKAKKVPAKKRKEKRSGLEEVLSIASHELKIPLTSLKAFTQLLHDRLINQLDTDSAGYLIKMDYQIEKMNNLINDLLDATRLSTGKLKFTNHKFNFDSLVGEVVEEMQPTTGRHEIIIKGRTGKEITADKTKICQVLVNLLSNAIKYSPDSDKIIVRLTPTADGVMCWIQDFGLGIAKEKQKLVFERFYRIEENRKQIPPGMGLGLYICAQIMDHHGGKIWVESESQEGSTFCFTLPTSAGQEKEVIT